MELTSTVFHEFSRSEVLKKTAAINDQKSHQQKKAKEGGMAAERPAGGEEKELRHNNNNKRPRARGGEAHTQNCVSPIYKPIRIY